MTNANGHGGSAPSLDDQKRLARAEAQAILGRCDPAAASQAVAARICVHVMPEAVVAGFYPLGRELDLMPLLRSMWGAGITLALPRTPARGSPLTFRRWAKDDDLLPERFGTMTSSGPPVEPGLLLVPLLAFDRRGHRLGYGGGFYDRTIAAMPGVRTVGCAYAALELPEVPAGLTDMRLNCIATEHEFITIKG